MQLGAGKCVYIDRSGVRCVGLCLGGTGHETHFKIRCRTALSWIASVRPDSRSSGIGDVAWAGTRSRAGGSGERDLDWPRRSRWTCDSGATECDFAGTAWLLECVHELGAGAFGVGMHESGVHAYGEFPDWPSSIWTAVRHAGIAAPNQLCVCPLRVSLLRLRLRQWIRSDLRSESTAAGCGSAANG